MSILKFKKPDGTWESIAAIKGEPGKDGAIQYQAGEGIKIEDNVISSVNSGEENNPSLYSLNVGLKFNGESPFTYTDADIVDRASAIIQDAYNKQFPTIGILLNGKRCVMFECASSTLTSNKLNSYTFYGYYKTDPVNYDLLGVCLYIGGSWSGETFTCKSVSGRLATSKIRMANQNDLLTKENTKSYTPTSDYHPATKKYVDDSIANIDVGGPKYVYEFDLKREGRPLNTTIILNDDEKERLRLLLNQILADGTVNTHVILLHNSLWDGRLIYLTPFYNSHLDDITASDFYQYLKYNGVFIDNATANDFGYEQFQLEVNYKSSTGESIDSMSTCKINWDYGYIIGTNNKYAFTPTSDYHPATKKYVDDSIAAIDIPEGGGADLTGYATEEYVDNAIANVPTRQIPKVVYCTFSDNPTNEYATEKELYLTNNAKTEITNLINEDISNPPPIILRSYNTYSFHSILLHPKDSGSSMSVLEYSGMYAISPTKINFYHLDINGGMQSGKFAPSVWYLKVKTLDISTYATKEDVNNAITSAITSVLEADY